MKKVWNAPVVEELSLQETAFGPQNPNVPDSDKTAVVEDGVIKGWKQEFGKVEASN